eukprot:s3262_g11.t1
MYQPPESCEFELVELIAGAASPHTQAAGRAQQTCAKAVFFRRSAHHGTEWTSRMSSNCRIFLCRLNTSPERAKQPLSCQLGTSHGSGQTLTCLENLEMWELSKGVPTNPLSLARLPAKRPERLV